MIIIVFFVGAIAVYALVMWIHIRKLKARVKNWSPHKGLALVLGIGRDKLFFPRLTPQERSDLKVRIAAPGEMVSDEEIDLFLRLYGRAFFWLLVGELSLFPAMVAVTAIMSSPNSGH